MRDYWTCSKFADWLRGTDKPSSGTSREWAQWKRASKEKHPIRYWIAEEGLDYVQDVWMWIPDRLNDIRYYVNNRWVTRTHALTAHPRDIKVGTWQDVGYRFLPCMMNELVDFVEIELAWNYCVWSDDNRAKHNYPWWRRWYRQWRSEEAAMEYIAWAKTLTNAEFLDEDKKHLAVPTHQAKTAAEIEIIYKWWKYERPQRPDPYEVSDWSAICKRRRLKHPDEILPEDDTEEEKSETRRSLDMITKLEAEYEQEDEEMMIRLIKIRQGLWT